MNIQIAPIGRATLIKQQPGAGDWRCAVQANVYEWVRNAVNKYSPQAPVLEVGSYNVNGTIRGLFPVPYTGFDIQPGPGVDEVGDVLTHHFAEEFNTIVCCETLEHVTRPWKAVERMARWLKPGGYMIVSAPFMHFVHEHPGDYYRFTGEGLRILFEDAGLQTIETEITQCHVPIPEKLMTAFGVAQKCP